MQAFYAIVEEGNISHAAMRLSVAQPALSRQMKKLEEGLGVQLFERGSRRIRLTDAGYLLYHRVKHILGMVDGTVREISDIGSGIAGTIRLGTITTSGAMLLPELVSEFHQKFPKVTFQLWEGEGARILEMLDSRSIDIAITRTQVDAENYDSLILEDEPLIMVMHKDLCCCGDDDKKVKLVELQDIPLLVPLRWRSVFLSHCSRMGFEPKILSVSDSVMQNLLWTRQGIGVSLVPYSAQSMLSGSHQLICKRLVEPEISTHTVVAWLKGRSLSSSCAQFINMFRDKYVKK